MAALDENLSVFEQNHIIEWRYGVESFSYKGSAKSASQRAM